MINAGRRGKRAPDGTGFLSTAEHFNQQNFLVPTVTSFQITDGSYVPTDDLAVDTAGGQTIVVNGSGFAPGASIQVGATTISVVTFVDSNRLSFTAPALSSGSYTIYVTNANGGTGILVPGLVYSGLPTFTTSNATPLVNVYETTSVSTSVSATGDAPITYSISSGALPDGVTLNSDGTITGTSPVDGSSTTYNFTIKASDAELQDSTRSFSLTVNTDVVTFDSPSANGTVYTAYEYVPFSNVVMEASSAAGYSANNFSANTLPTGLTLSGNTISGTVNTSGNTNTRLTATASTTNRTAVRDVVFNVAPDIVTWNTPTENYSISAYEYSAISNVTANATSAAGFGMLYSSNTTPTGISLNVSSGLISGTPTTVGTTYAELTATANTTSRTNTRNVVYTVNQDVVTWSTPTADATYTLAGGSAISNVSLSATSAAGKTISYTANSLPTGLTLSGDTIYGTPTTSETIYTSLTATADTTNRSAVRYISWTVTIGDSFFKNTALLMSADTSLQTRNFIADNSLHNQQVTVAGDVKSTNFNPYQEGYYSTQFNGSSQYLTLPASSDWDFGSGAFTIECWIKQNYITSTAQVIAFHGWSGSGAYNYGWNLRTDATTGALGIYVNGDQRSFSDLTVKSGTWHHVAICGNGGTISAYLNGTKSATTYSYTSFVDRATMTLVLGGWNDNSESIASRYWFGGQISNFRILKGTALYSASFTPSTTPLLPVANTKALIAQSSRIIDNSANTATITAVNTPVITSVSPFSTVYQTGTQYYSTKFNGSGDYLTLPSNTAYDFGSGDFTIEAWIYPSAIASNRVFLSTQTNGNASAGWSCFLFSSGYIGFDVFEGSEKTLTASTTQLAVGNWYHIAYTRQSGTMRMFVNGVSQTFSGTQATNINSATSFTIGRQQQAGYTYDFAGNISNVRVVKGTALYTSGFTPSTTPLTTTSQDATASQVSVLTCQDSTFKDNSLNAFAVTAVTTSVQPVTASPFTPSSYTNTPITTYGSGYFDGTTDYITVPNGTPFGFGTGDFTVELWWNPSTTGTYMTLFDTSAAGDATATGRFLFDHQSGGYIRVYTDAGTTQLLISGAAAVKAYQWNHIAVTRSGVTGRLFINGVLVNTNTNMTTNFLPKTNRPIIGANGYDAGTTGFGSYISDLRVLKGTALYTSSFVPPKQPTTAVANTQLLMLQTNGEHHNIGFKDSSGFNNILTKYGNPTNGTFSPYGDNWSNYFPGSGSYLSCSHSSLSVASATLAWTFECWVYPITSAYFICIGSGGAWGNSLLVDWGKTTTNKFSVSQSNGGSAPVNFSTTNTYTAQSWYHVMVTNDTNGVRRLFINGTQDGTQTYTAASLGSGTTLVINGAYDNNGIGYNGGQLYVSNMRALIGTTLQSSNFTPDTVPLNNIANTKVLTASSCRFIDNSLNNLSFTIGGSPQVQKFSPFSTVTVPKYYSTYFNGTTDYISVPAPITTYKAFDWSGTSWTIEGWFNFNSVSASKGLFTYPDLLEAKYDGTNLIFIYRNTPASAVWTTNSTAYALQTNTWYHIALVLNNGSMRAYVNGTAIGTANNGVGAGARGSTTGLGENFFIGANDTYQLGFGVLDTFMSGCISNFRISKIAVYTGNFTVPTSPLSITQNSDTNISALTSGQVTLLTFQDNKFIDKTSNSWPITAGTTTVKPLTLSPFTTTASSSTNYSRETFGGSMYFDGNGDYMTAPNTNSFNLSSGPWTAECWFYQTSSKTVTLFSVGATVWRLVSFSNGGGHFYFGSSETLIPTGTFKLGQWNHFAVSVVGDGSSSNLRIYVNGVHAVGGALVPANDTTTTFYVGRNVDAGSGWDMNGYISDLRITKGENVYKSNFYPPTTPLQVTANTTFMLKGDTGILDATRTADLESVAEAKVVNFGPYNTNYYSAYQNGDDARLSVPAGAAFNMGSGDFSIEMWVNTISGSQYGALLTFDAADYPICIYYGSSINSGNIMAAVGTGSTWFTNTSAMTFGTTVPGKWSHILLTRSGDNWRCFQDGVLRYYASQSGTVGDSSGNIYIGANGSTIYRVTSYISNVRIIKGSVPTDYQTSSTTTGTTIFTPSTSPLTTTSQGATSSHVSLLTCQNNKFIDNSPNGFTVTNNNSGIKVVPTNPFQVNNAQSYYFDGTGDYLALKEDTGLWYLGTSDFTFEAWVNPAARVTNGAYIISRSQYGVGSDWGWWITNAGTLQFYMLTGGSGNIVTSTGTVPLNQWTHVAVVRSGTTISLYINGTNDGTKTNYSSALTASYGPTVIGNSSNNTGSVYFNGYISDLRITKGVARTISVPTAPLPIK